MTQHSAPTAPAGRPRTGLLGSRVARRLLGLFVLAAFVPLAVTSWLSGAAVNDLVATYARRFESRAVQQVSMQVLDRLMMSKALMQAWPVSAAGLPARAADTLPGQGRVFTAVARLEHGAVTWASPQGAGLARAWAQAGSGEAKGKRVAAQRGIETPLRVWFDNGVPRLLMALQAHGQLVWLAELKTDALWQPIADAAVESRWTVLDEQRRPLVASGELPGNGEALRLFEAKLFLGGEFGAADWTFVQQRAGALAILQGQKLTTWLALVALATVLLVTLLSLAQIRRTLVPLQQLIAGTRRLAAGDTHVRVPVHGRDEFGVLAQAFNHMAGRLQAQIRSLEGMARIDRDILAGAATEQVVEHVLSQLAALYPRAWTAVVWIDPGHAPAQAAGLVGAVQAAGLVRGPGPAGQIVAKRLSLTAAEAGQFGQLAQDEASPRKKLARQPWCTLVRHEGVRWLALLPVPAQGGNRALLVLGLPGGVREAALRPGRDLRDRFAVALAARQRERTLAHQAVHDSLTGLANRQGMLQALQAWLEPADAEHHSAGRGAVLLVDLDHFKHINDSLGHDCGDQVLREAAQRLQDAQRACMPAGATVARPGGDEFVLVLPGADAARAHDVAADVLARLRRPFDVSGTGHVLGASIGIALAPAHGATEAELLRHADLAMYAAKTAGRHQAVLFEPVMDEQAHQRVRLVTELRRAIAQREFVAYFQPRVRPADGAITSAEALVRWQHPTRGLLPPGEFIGLAETSDELIEGIGVAMLEAACEQMARWRREGVGLPRVSVNVSTRQLTSGRLLGQVRSALARHGLPAQVLELEVTESLLMGDTQQARACLAELRRWGVAIALDDFGTGYSSMAMLRQLPIDVIKIDRAFVKDLGRDDDGALAIARAIVALAQSLKLHLVAEGIETMEQARVLQELGCDELQGYLYSPPVPAARFERLPGLSRIEAPAADLAETN